MRSPTLVSPQLTLRHADAGLRLPANPLGVAVPSSPERHAGPGGPFTSEDAPGGQCAWHAFVGEVSAMNNDSAAASGQDWTSTATASRPSGRSRTGRSAAPPADSVAPRSGGIGLATPAGQPNNSSPARKVTAPAVTPSAAVTAEPAPNGAVDSVLSTLLGSNQGAPVESPVSWVVMAAARFRNRWMVCGCTVR